MKKLSLSLASLCISAISLSAAPIDLSSWTPLTLTFPGGQPAGNWQVQSGNTTVIQTINADPSFFLNNVNQTSYSMDGTWRVNTTSDDDFMGFVFGYQDSSNFYLFDWKEVNQDSYGGSASEGMTIKKYAGATGNGLADLSLAEFWENENSLDNMTVLARNHGSTKGWEPNTLYSFHLDFNLNLNEIHIVVKEGADVLWDQTVFDDSFTGGQFGFYNFSQQSVEYAGFEQTGGVLVGVPEGGAAAALFGIGLASLAAVRRAVRRP